MDKNKLKILLVDDEPESLALLQRTLRQDYETVSAKNGQEGLGCLEKHSFAVIISDQRMPGMTGVTFLSKAFRRYPYTQRILLTGYTEVEGLIDAINTGQVFGYLAKPWHPNALLAILQRALDAFLLLNDNERLLLDLQNNNQKLQILLKETRELEAAKLQAERWAALGKLAGMVAHDMRNPLTAIQCHAGLLHEMEMTVENKARSFNVILEQVQHMKHYIDDLLQFTKPTNSHTSLRPYVVSALLVSLQETFIDQCKENNINLTINNSYKGKVDVNPHRIYRALGNLLQNALEAAGKGGEIFITSEEIDEQKVVIRIADSGAGVPAEVGATLFEPFVSCNKDGGTGLGLAIVKKIIEEHKGHVWEEEWGLKGACFHITLRKSINP